MPENRETNTLNYEAPVDRLHRLRLERKRVPHTRLGIISCCICGMSICSSAIYLLLSRVNLEESYLGTIVGGIAVLFYALCLAAGIPLALGGFGDQGHRKRFALIGLIANALWLFGPLVLLMLYSWNN